jgi:hypothetical protein
MARLTGCSVAARFPRVITCSSSARACLAPLGSCGVLATVSSQSPTAPSGTGCHSVRSTWRAILPSPRRGARRRRSGSASGTRRAATSPCGRCVRSAVTLRSRGARGPGPAAVVAGQRRLPGWRGLVAQRAAHPRRRGRPRRRARPRRGGVLARGARQRVRGGVMGDRGQLTLKPLRRQLPCGGSGVSLGLNLG